MEKEPLKVYNQELIEDEIEQLVDGGYNYMEAVCFFCEQKDIDFLEIKQLLTPKLLTKIRNSAIELNYIKGKKICSLL